MEIKDFAFDPDASGACLAGVQAAADAEIIILMDGDGSDVPEDSVRVWEPVQTGAATVYQNPAYPAGAIRNGRKVDPRLRSWESTNSTLKSVAPRTYARLRARFIAENGIKDR